MTKTPATFPDPEMLTSIPDTGNKCPKTDVGITYLEKNIIDKAIRQKLKKKDSYKTDVHNIYNLIVGQTNEQLQEKVALETNFQAVNTGRDPIWYLMILKKLCFSN